MTMTRARRHLNAIRMSRDEAGRRQSFYSKRNGDELAPFWYGGARRWALMPEPIQRADAAREVVREHYLELRDLVSRRVELPQMAGMIFVTFEEFGGVASVEATLDVSYERGGDDDELDAKPPPRIRACVRRVLAIVREYLTGRRFELPTALELEYEVAQRYFTDVPWLPGDTVFYPVVVWTGWVVASLIRRDRMWQPEDRVALLRVAPLAWFLWCDRVRFYMRTALPVLDDDGAFRGRACCLVDECPF